MFVCACKRGSNVMQRCGDALIRDPDDVGVRGAESVTREQRG